MERLEKITTLGNEIEAQVLDEALSDAGIPHVIRSYFDSAYDGIFQRQWGWGCVEAPPDRKDEVMEILYDLRNNLRIPDEDLGEGQEEAPPEHAG